MEKTHHPSTEVNRPAGSTVAQCAESGLLSRELGSLKLCNILIAPSSLSLHDSSHLLRSNDEVLLVQDFPDTFEGVVSRAQIDDALESGDSRVQLGQVVDRQIAIEPEFATLSELVDRFVYGGMSFAVVVDRQGRPQSVISLDTVRGLVPSISL